MRLLRDFKKGFIDILYPRVCLACKKILTASCEEEFICLECCAKIKMNTPPFCRRCGRNVPGNNRSLNTCTGCLKQHPQFDRAFSPCVYEGVIKELIHAFKYKGKDYLGKFLTKPMIDYIKEYNLPMQQIDFIIPVPLHKARLRERGFNQASLLASPISVNFNKDFLEAALMRKFNTRTQTDLDDHKRQLNVKDSFCVNPKYISVFKDKTILLIDDVLTTGATASEAAGALKHAKVKTVYVLTLAN